MTIVLKECPPGLHVIYRLHDRVLNEKEFINFIHERELQIKLDETGMDRFDYLYDNDLSDALDNIVQIEVGKHEHLIVSSSEYDKCLTNPKFKTLHEINRDKKRATVEADLIETKPIEPSEKLMTTELPVVHKSYENCYGLIDTEAEDFIAFIFRPDRAGATIYDKILSSKMPLKEIKNHLASISHNNYDDKRRRGFFILNIMLAERGIAPRWRGIVRDRHYRSKTDDISEQHKKYLRDIQTLDLHWLFRRHNGHDVDETWNGEFFGVLSGEMFNTKQASIVAAIEMKPATKARYLQLTPDMERELQIIRSAETNKAVTKLIDQQKKVKIELITAANRNRKRGSKLTDNLQRRLDLWLAAKLIPNASIAIVIENYRMICGETLSLSNCKRLITSTNGALDEVGSKNLI